MPPVEWLSLIFSPISNHIRLLPNTTSRCSRKFLLDFSSHQALGNSLMLCGGG